MAPRNKDPKLIIRVIIFELVQPICPGYINVTDRRTDSRMTYDSNTALALRASRGKNWLPNLKVMSEDKVDLSGTPCITALWYAVCGSGRVLSFEDTGHGAISVSRPGQQHDQR